MMFLTGDPPELKLVVDGREYNSAEIEGIIRWAIKWQYGTVDDILKERGLMPLDSHLIDAPSEPIDIGEGWQIASGSIFRSQHCLFALIVPYLWMCGGGEEARASLREKMQTLGDYIWGARAKSG